MPTGSGAALALKLKSVKGMASTMNSASWPAKMPPAGPNSVHIVVV